MTLPVLSGERVTLRAPEPRDVEDRLRCGRDAEMLRMLGDDPSGAGPITREAAEGWLARTRDERGYWAIEVDGRCVGSAGLIANADGHTARFGITIFDASARGGGIGTEVTRLIVRHGLEALGFERISLRVLKFNERAIRCYERAGFVVLGELPVEVAWGIETDLQMEVDRDAFRRAVTA